MWFLGDPSCNALSFYKCGITLVPTFSKYVGTIVNTVFNSFVDYNTSTALLDFGGLFSCTCYF